MNFQIVIDALLKIGTDIVNFIPNLINGLIIVVVGYLVSVVVRWIVRVVLRNVRFDPMIERTGITGSLRGLSVKMPMSEIVAQTVFLLLLLSFLITATRLIGLEAVARLLEQLLGFLPNAVAAVIVFLLGGIVSKFMGDLVTTMAMGAGLGYGRRIGRLVQYVISVFVAVLALGVLGIDTALLVTALTILIAAFGLALGLALGLGARGIVNHVLAGYYMRQRLPVGRPIAFQEVRGEVGGIGGVNTVVTTPEGEVIIPNGVLLDSIVRAPRPAAPEERPAGSA